MKCVNNAVYDWLYSFICVNLYRFTYDREFLLVQNKINTTEKNIE
jgi:hypothetical protein